MKIMYRVIFSDWDIPRIEKVLCERVTPHTVIIDGSRYRKSSDGTYYYASLSAAKNHFESFAAKRIERIGQQLNQWEAALKRVVNATEDTIKVVP
jgi:hypothetical protein